jgi:hypothetical protein
MSDTRPDHRGSGIVVGKDGPQIVRTGGKRWSDEAEAAFLDHLAATCNVTASAAACGFTATAVYKRRRRDPAFHERWKAALVQGAVRLSALLLQRAIESLEGFAPDADTPIPAMTVNEALAVLTHHRREVEGGPRSRRQWARPRSLDEMRGSILAKLEAIAPTAPASPAAGAGEGSGAAAPGPATLSHTPEGQA